MKKAKSSATTTVAKTTFDPSKFITGKSYQKKQVPYLNDKEFWQFCQKISEALASKINLVSFKMLEETTNLVTGEVSPKTLSYFVWYGFINISANGTVFYKNNNKYSTIARMGDGKIEFLPAANDTLKSIVNWQSKATLEVADTSF